LDLVACLCGSDELDNDPPDFEEFDFDVEKMDDVFTNVPRSRGEILSSSLKELNLNVDKTEFDVDDIEIQKFTEFLTLNNSHLEDRAADVLGDRAITHWTPKWELSQISVPPGVDWINDPQVQM
jgi:hypothetical protein